MNLPNRLRRLRKSEYLRDILRENKVSRDDLICPLFINEDISEPKEVKSMPGVFQIPLSHTAETVKNLESSGIKAILLFGITSQKDDLGSRSWAPDGVQLRMISEARKASDKIIIFSDNCFCEYTTHGHCGVLTNGDLDNDLTLENLTKQAIASAKAGADFISPSGMLDGMVANIRAGLDSEGLHNTGIMSYSTKFASAFYGPFRDAVESNFKGNRNTYQLDPANGRIAIEESLQDEQEGADILMVKPGIAYLDILSKIRARTSKPLAVYQVSGEYAMIKFAAANGALNEEQAIAESMLSFKRAGADLIITYFAPKLSSLI